jgi:hypothetical protein
MSPRLTSGLAFCVLAACSSPKVSPASARDGGADDTADAAGRQPDANFNFMVTDAAPGEPRPTETELDCATAAMDKGNAGCSFYAVPIPVSGESGQSCFAMYVVNPGASPVKLALDRGGAALSLAKAARLPRGTGQHLTYDPFDEQAGLPPGGVAILFLAPALCPAGITPALDTPPFTEDDKLSSGTGQSFHLVADRPVVAYQIIPYGGAGSHVTSATLLLPHESWGTHHVTVTPPFLSTFVVITAAEDGTEVTFRPTDDVMGAGAVPAIRKGATGHITLAAGQFARFKSDFASTDGLSGGVVSSNKPVSVMGGSSCFNMPVDHGACDSAHQQMPPLEALGNEYAAVRYRNRMPNVDESVPWQIVGAVDGTTLTYAPAAPAGAPTTVAAGQSVVFSTRDAFVVRSQDSQHPFYVAGYMTGFTVVDPSNDGPWPGDPEFVNVVPPAQFRSSYVFFTDPTYPDTNLVVVRKRGADGQFADVRLDCSTTPLAGWAPVGDYQFTRVDLVAGNFTPVIPGCDNGRHTISSAAPFGVTVWGWGSKQVTIGADWTGATSYAYPAGASIQRANTAPPPVIQ